VDSSCGPSQRPCVELNSVGWLFKQVFFVVALQTAVAYAMGAYDVHWGLLVLTSYWLGGFANHNLFLAVHELAHGLAFESPLANRCLGLVANFPTIFPFAVTFQKYHLEHHQHQGVDNVDMDIPTYWEASWAVNALTKTLWVSFQLFFYALRPLFVKPKPAGAAEAVNLLTCAAYDAAMFYYAGPKAIVYLLLSTVLGGGLHPIAGHFISEHYVFKEGQETYSYYGPLNWVIYNAGYHNEHHDFPRIPGSRLKQVHCTPLFALLHACLCEPQTKLDDVFTARQPSMVAGPLAARTANNMYAGMAGVPNGAGVLRQPGIPHVMERVHLAVHQ
jgi:sphingolipid delta-4 desaturase